MVALRCTENSTASRFAASICSARKARKALRLMTEASMISPAIKGVFAFSTATLPSFATISMRALVGAVMVVATSEP